MFIEHIYNDERVYYCLNKKEIKYLFNFCNLLCDENRFMIEFYNEVPDRVDNKRFVFEKAGSLKYHLFHDCPSLNKNFIDFHIPDEIRKIGDQAIEEYRTWFKEKGFAQDFFSGKKYQERMIFSYNMKFPKKYSIPSLNEQFKLIEERPNSNYTKINGTFDLKAFQSRLDYYVELFNTLFSCPVLRKLAKFKNLHEKSDKILKQTLGNVITPQFVTNYGIEETKEKLKHANEIGNSIMDLLIEYFKWNGNMNSKKFNVINLEKFGLECCGYCKSEVSKSQFNQINQP
jgi:hypothetical protein